MFTVLVTLDVLPERLDEFLTGIRVNSRASRNDEPGCLRFDVYRSLEDPCRFVLHEIYRDQAAFYEQHRSTPHYAVWREVSARCVRPGGHVNSFLTPAFLEDMPELSHVEVER